MATRATAHRIVHRAQCTVAGNVRGSCEQLNPTQLHRLQPSPTTPNPCRRHRPSSTTSVQDRCRSVRSISDGLQRRVQCTGANVQARMYRRKCTSTHCDHRKRAWTSHGKSGIFGATAIAEGCFGRNQLGQRREFERNNWLSLTRHRMMEGYAYCTAFRAKSSSKSNSRQSNYEGLDGFTALQNYPHF